MRAIVIDGEVPRCEPEAPRMVTVQTGGVPDLSPLHAYPVGSVVHRAVADGLGFVRVEQLVRVGDGTWVTYTPGRSS